MRGRQKWGAGRGWTVRLAACAAALLLPLAPAAAQVRPAPTTPDSVRAGREPLFVPADALVIPAIMAGTLALAPLDLSLADELQDSTRQTNRVLRDLATSFRLLGHPGAVVISGGTYLAGRALHRPELADVGLHVGESVGSTMVLTSVIKWVAGRARPEEDPNTPHSFKLGRGWRDDPYQSFPSGHTSAAFATAASVSTELGRLYPHTRTWARPLLYGAAGLVGVSRMYNNKHWASDVAAGAGLGTFTAWKVVRYNHTHPNNRLDRFFLATSLGLAPDGAPMLAWSGKF